VTTQLNRLQSSGPFLKTKTSPTPRRKPEISTGISEFALLLHKEVDFCSILLKYTEIKGRLYNFVSKVHKIYQR
jgi:hypothetical protein